MKNHDIIGKEDVTLERGMKEKEEKERERRRRITS